MNYVIRELTLYRHFLLIDSPIPFEFIANPTNYNKDMSDFSRVTGLDVCSRPSGCWRVDCWKLLPKEFQRNNPVFTMLLKYDADLLGEGEVVDVRYSDIDVGEGVAGVNGQLVQILPSTFQPVVNAVDDFKLSNHLNINALNNVVSEFKSSFNSFKGSNHEDFISVKDSVDTLQTSNHADLGLVKASVDTLQTSNHADLGLVKASVDALQTSNHADLGLVKASVDALSISSRQSFIFNERIIPAINIGGVGSYSIPTFYSFSPVALAGTFGNGVMFFDVENFPSNYVNKYSFSIKVSEVATPDGMKFKFIISSLVNGVVTSRDFLMSSPFQDVFVYLYLAGGARV